MGPTVKSSTNHEVRAARAWDDVLDLGAILLVIQPAVGYGSFYTQLLYQRLSFFHPSDVQSSTQNPQNGKQKHTHVTEADYQVLFMHISVAISYHSCSYYGKRLQNGTQRQRQNTGDAKHTHHQPSGNGRDRARCCEAAGVLTIYKKEKEKKKKRTTHLICQNTMHKHTTLLQAKLISSVPSTILFSDNLFYWLHTPTSIFI